MDRENYDPVIESYKLLEHFFLGVAIGGTIFLIVAFLISQEIITINL